MRSRRSASSGGRVAVRSSDAATRAAVTIVRERAGSMCIFEPLPRGDGAQLVGRGLHPQPQVRARAGRALAVAVHQHPEPGEGLLPGDLLLDDRGHQRLHHQPGASQPRVRVPSAGLDEHRVPGLEGAPVVVGAEQRRHGVEHPLRAAPPGLRRAPRRRADATPATASPGPRGCARRARSARPRRRGTSGRPAPRRCCPATDATWQGQSGRQVRLRGSWVTGPTLRDETRSSSG